MKGNLIELMLNAPIIGTRLRWPNVLHAIEMEGLPIETWPNGKARSACGLTGLRIRAFGDVFAPWPPRLKGLPDGWVRCEKCHQATGRKRPRCTFGGSE